MAQFILRPIALTELSSIDLGEVAQQEATNPTIEAYKVIMDNHAEWAECLYLGDRDIAGIAWGADATWLEHVGSAEEACEQEFNAV